MKYLTDAAAFLGTVCIIAAAFCVNLALGLLVAGMFLLGWAVIAASVRRNG